MCSVCITGVADVGTSERREERVEERADRREERSKERRRKERREERTPELPTGKLSGSIHIRFPPLAWDKPVRRNHGGGIMEEESCQEILGDARRSEPPGDAQERPR